MNATDGDTSGLGVDDAESVLGGSDGLDHVTLPTEPGSWWTGIRGFCAVAALLLVLLLGLIPVMNNGAVAAPDDGLYAAQAKLLTDGTWSERRPAAAIDANGVNSTIGPSFVYKDRQIPYLRHPLFPTVLSWFYRVGGFDGLIAFSVLGVWLAAIAAGLMGRMLDHRYGMLALLLTGIASPLIFDAYLVSAHGMAAGLSGFVALGVAHLIDRRRAWHLAYALPCAVLLVALRTEGIIVLLATTAVVGLFAIRLRPFRIDRLAIVTAGGVGVVSLLAYLADSRWTQSLKQATGSANQPLLREAISNRDPFGAAWISLIRPWYGSTLNANSAVVFAVVAILLAAATIRISAARWLLPVSLLVLAAASLLYQQFGDDVLISGLISAFPVAIGGLILLRRQDLTRHLIPRHLLISMLAIITITVTSYSNGGAIEWGGRFYHVIIPLLVPVAMVGLHHGYRKLPRWPARIAAGAVIVISVSLSLLALGYLHSARELSSRMLHGAIPFTHEQVRSSGTDARELRPLLIVGMLYPDGTGRTFWDASGDIDVISSSGVADLFTVIARARNAGYPSVSVITPILPTTLSVIGNKRLEGTGWGIRDLKPILDTPFGLAEFGPPDG